MKSNFRWLIYSIVLTIAAVGIWIGYKDQEKILASLSVIGWGGFAFLCLLSTLNYALRYLRWSYLLRVLGDRAPAGDSLMCYCTGFALTTTPAKAGEVVRCFYFNQRHNVDYSHTLAGLFTERAQDSMAALLVGTLALYSFEDVRWIGAAFTFALVVAVFLVSHQKILLRTVEAMRIIRLRVFNALLDLVPPLLQRASTLLSPRPFTLGVVIGVFAWSAEGFAFAWLARELGGEGSVLLYMSIFCIAIVAGALTFVPGGLGGTEVVMYVLCVATGMGEAEAITATVLIRLATLWYAVVLGLLAMLWLETHKDEIAPAKS